MGSEMVYRHGKLSAGCPSVGAHIGVVFKASWVPRIGIPFPDECFQELQAMDVGLLPCGEHGDPHGLSDFFACRTGFKGIMDVIGNTCPTTLCNGYAYGNQFFFLP